MWIIITDTDGSEALTNFDTIKGIKAFGADKTTITFDNGNTVQINNNYKDLKAQLLGLQKAIVSEPELLQESKEDVDMPEPMKAPTGKVGSGEKPEAIISKLTKKGGTTSAALE